MNFPKTNRLYKIRIYLKDSPIPLFHVVRQLFSEGSLLRLMNDQMESIWYPLCNIDKIIEEEKIMVEEK